MIWSSLFESIHISFALGMCFFIPETDPIDYVLSPPIKHKHKAKLIWIDSKSDDQIISPLTYLYGRTVQDGQSVLQCMNPLDMAHIGVTDADVSVENGLKIGQMRCKT
jgi:hypothetical protein